jgi:hypothetical protein
MLTVIYPHMHRHVDDVLTYAQTCRQIAHIDGNTHVHTHAHTYAHTHAHTHTHTHSHTTMRLIANNTAGNVWALER